MAAQISDLLTQATTNSRPSPTQVTSTRAGGGTTLSCNVLTGWPTGTACHFITYKLDTSGVKVAGSQIDMKGVVSGTNITQIVIKAGSDVGNAIGDVVEAAPTAAWANDVVTWGTAHANQDGSLLTSAVQTALGLTSLNGYTPVGFTPATVTCNGNRSYTMVFNGQDLTSFLSAGMRIRTTRTVAAPTQSTSLNGTTQYWSKTSPAGMTFTNNFVASAWVKLTSYGATSTISSRFDGTSGWTFTIESTGQVQLAGFNAGIGNNSLVKSYQSIPLNKWVHVAAQLDMLTFTATTTTSYVMIDGLDVLASVSRTGTNPTALIQAGNLLIGAQQAGTLLFPGKIAQPAIYSAKVTQATILASISQGLAGTETSLISAYSFNGTANDLNTTNANNLTANGAVTATNADSPFGGQASGLISSTLDYAVLRDVSFSTNTTVTVQTLAGNTIPTSGGVSAVVYSSNDVPYGFPGGVNDLGYAQICSTFTSTSTTFTVVSGLSVTTYVPPNRDIEFAFQARDVFGNTVHDFEIFEGTVSGLAIGGTEPNISAGAQIPVVSGIYRPSSSGIKTYIVAYKLNAGTGTVEASTSAPAFLRVKVAS